MKQISKFRMLLPRIIFMIIAAGCGLLFVFYIRWWEFFFLDLKFLLAQYTTMENHVSREIALILLDDNTRKRLYITPYGSSIREHHGRVVAILTEAGARDFLFSWIILLRPHSLSKIKRNLKYPGK